MNSGTTSDTLISVSSSSFCESDEDERDAHQPQAPIKHGLLLPWRYRWTGVLYEILQSDGFHLQSLTSERTWERPTDTYEQMKMMKMRLLLLPSFSSYFNFLTFLLLPFLSERSCFQFLVQFQFFKLWQTDVQPPDVEADYSSLNSTIA